MAFGLYPLHNTIPSINRIRGIKVNGYSASVEEAIRRRKELEKSLKAKPKKKKAASAEKTAEKEYRKEIAAYKKAAYKKAKKDLRKKKKTGIFRIKKKKQGKKLTRNRPIGLI